MNKFLKIGGSILGAGIVIFFIAFAISGFDITRLYTQPPLKQKEYVSSSKIDSITIDDDLDITIDKSPDSKVHISYFENKKVFYKINKNSDLVFKKTYNYKWYDKLFNFNIQELSVSVLLPENYNGDIKVLTNNGKIKSNNISVKNMDISTSNGIIDFNSVNALGDIKVKTSNGKIIFHNIDAIKDISCSTTSGVLNFNNVNANNISAKTSNGKVNYSNLNAKNNISAKSSNGKINIAKIQVGKELNLETSNGAISGSIIGQWADFSIKSQTSNGKNNLPEDMPSGSKKLFAKTSNGSININFQKSKK